ncbi:MAG: nucleotidyltransferase [Rhodothermaceae bacterium]|nr:nucleotidyltransferase [Rhodothermaceae bacterium]MXZ58529.1 nucleotidyltransferase [Rhodothermaceae bacterium]MYD67706.1 nucleotidyltransferase [Rhodothermaceae bacterium]MYH12206.1 nucleotidyltransferase [Rhodothermaceae bacterium]MYJ06362.1 nucleotidyltransferase [Rhodothermaceae bacterium]
MILKKAFDNFLRDRVNLNQTRIDRIISAHHSVREKLEEDEWISKYFIDSKLQGSYALGTAIRSSHKEGTYDVDVVLGLDLEDEYGQLPSGISVLKNVQSALEEISLYSGKTEILKCCVRVAYSSDGLDFHLDVVPAHVPEGMRDPLQIPRDWDKTNPLGYIDWFNETNRNGSGHLRRVVRLVKYWKDLHKLESPNSMVLTTLAGRFLPKEALSVDDALVQVLGGMIAWADECSNADELDVPNPSLPEENLARDWHFDQFTSFRDRLRSAYEDAKTARDSIDEQETIDLWNGPHLFDGKFPTEVSKCSNKYQEVANDFSKAQVGVSPSGVIGSLGVVPPYNRGYYGRGGLRQMRNRNKSFRDSMACQKLAMKSKFPDFQCGNKGDGIVFTGTLKPGETLQSYKIAVKYTPSCHPKVFVLSPELHSMAPHVWPDDKSLCLVNPKVFPWHPSHLVAKVTIPWTALWLFFYEGWLDTGIWYGPEFPHDDGVEKFQI